MLRLTHIAVICVLTCICSCKPNSKNPTSLVKPNQEKANSRANGSNANPGCQNLNLKFGAGFDLVSAPPHLVVDEVQIRDVDGWKEINVTTASPYGIIFITVENRNGDGNEKRKKEEFLRLYPSFRITVAEPGTYKIGVQVCSRTDTCGEAKVSEFSVTAVDGDRYYLHTLLNELYSRVSTQAVAYFADEPQAVMTPGYFARSLDRGAVRSQELLQLAETFNPCPAMPARWIPPEAQTPTPTPTKTQTVTTTVTVTSTTTNTEAGGTGDGRTGTGTSATPGTSAGGSSGDPGAAMAKRLIEIASFGSGAFAALKFGYSTIQAIKSEAEYAKVLATEQRITEVFEKNIEDLKNGNKEGTFRELAAIESDPAVGRTVYRTAMGIDFDARVITAVSNINAYQGELKTLGKDYAKARKDRNKSLRQFLDKQITGTRRLLKEQTIALERDIDIHKQTRRGQIDVEQKAVYGEHIKSLASALAGVVVGVAAGVVVHELLLVTEKKKEKSHVVSELLEMMQGIKELEMLQAE